MYLPRVPVSSHTDTQWTSQPRRRSIALIWLIPVTSGSTTNATPIAPSASDTKIDPSACAKATLVPIRRKPK